MLQPSLVTRLCKVDIQGGLGLGRSGMPTPTNMQAPGFESIC